MSLDSITWALKSAPVTDPTQIVILIALADRSHDDGTCAWPAQQWLADRARCSTRTVRRHLAALEECGLIRRGDQEFVSHLPADRRPVVWDLAIEMTSDVRPDNMTGRTRVSKRQDNGGHDDRTPVSYKPSLLPTGETVPEPSLARAPAKSTRGTRLPANWMPSDPVIQTMKAECPQVDLAAEHRKFCDYWKAATGRNASKADWDATWRNWIRNARPSAQTGVPMGTTTAKFNEWLRYGPDSTPDLTAIEGAWS